MIFSFTKYTLDFGTHSLSTYKSSILKHVELYMWKILPSLANIASLLHFQTN